MNHRRATPSVHEGGARPARLDPEPADNKRFPPPRCQHAHAPCPRIHRVRAPVCHSMAALVATTPCFLPPTSDTVQNRLQKHAGHRRSPRPRRRAPHGAQPDLFPFSFGLFYHQIRQLMTIGANHDRGKNLFMRQRKRRLKHCFCFGGIFPR